MELKEEVQTQANNLLPKCAFCYTCCAECKCGNYDEKREQVWCGKDRRWYNRSDGCNRV